MVRFEQASFDSQNQLQYCSGRSCNSIVRRRRASSGAGRGRGSRQHLPAVAGFRLPRVSIAGRQIAGLSVPECVMFKSAPVALRCTRMSFDLASLVSGPNAPDFAIFALLSSCVARFVMHPTALHCTSTFGEFICLMRGLSPPSATMFTLFSAAHNQQQPDAR